MKLTYILLIALLALALHLGWTGIVAPALAGGNGGINGGDVHSLAGSKRGASINAGNSLAGSKIGIGSGSNGAMAGGRGGMSGDL